MTQITKVIAGLIVNALLLTGCSGVEEKESLSTSPAAAEAPAAQKEEAESPVVNGELDIDKLNELTDRPVITSQRVVSLMEIDPETRELLTPNIRTEAFYDFEADVALLVDYVDDEIVRQQA